MMVCIKIINLKRRFYRCIIYSCIIYGFVIVYSRGNNMHYELLIQPSFMYITLYNKPPYNHLNHV